mgnify:CR=1 FL=1
MHAYYTKETNSLLKRKKVSMNVNLVSTSNKQMSLNVHLVSLNCKKRHLDNLYNKNNFCKLSTFRASPFSCI